MVNKQTDDSLVLDFKNNINQEECLKEIIRRHKPLCLDMVERYRNRLDASGSLADEIVKDSPFLIYDALKKYDPTRGSMKISTYIGQTVRFHCLHQINKRKIEIHDPELLGDIIDANEFLNHQFDNSPRKDLTLDRVLDILSKLGDDRILSIYKMRYSDITRKRLSWKKIAESLNLSTQWVRCLHKKALSYIRSQIRLNPSYNN